MSWIAESIRETNRAARVLRGGPSRLSPSDVEEVVAGLCQHYTNLIFDPSFRRDIEFVADKLTPSFKAQPDQPELHCHFNEAIALLAEAGVDGELAVEALRDLEQAVLDEDAYLDPIWTAGFFDKLSIARKRVCAVRHSLLAQSETNNLSFRKYAWANIGLAVVGLSASGAALLTPPAASGAAIVTGGAAVLSAIGSTLFQHSTKAPT
jgi:hypothetical protein